jgi:hypothetical protein
VPAPSPFDGITAVNNADSPASCRFRNVIDLTVFTVEFTVGFTVEFSFYPHFYPHFTFI